MSQRAMRVFSTTFKESAVLRLAAGERLAEVARELGIARKLLYEWRAAYRRFGRQAIDIDFFREALRLIDARDPWSRATPSTRSSKR
jgi:transposase-like protein